TRGVKNKEIGQGIADWLALPFDVRACRLDLYRASFLTQKDMVKKIYDGLEDSRPDIPALFESEREALLRTLDQMAAINQCQLTADLLTIAAEIMTAYTNAKRHRNALDFTDLIAKTRELLEQKGEDWVHFKLDEGIDHILVDEAQDTNIDQWKIIEYLSAELQSGLGRETKSPRSLFVVGDKKQSIFSFHGADPESFTRMRHFFENRSKQAEREFDTVNLETSFRTTKPVLSLVDQVFSNPDLTRQLGLEPNENLVHYSFRENEAGKVELWDVITKENEEKKDTDATWLLPFSKERSSPSNGAPHSLATRIANKIEHIIEGKELVPSTGRPAAPRDILVLVRTRTGPFITSLVRQLKIKKIAVSGIDRMALRDQIAVEDCLALARFVRLPADDLSLACLLKSPFIRIDEDQLMELALGRKKDETLWSRAEKHLPEETVAWIKEQVDMGSALSPFNFFNETLSCPCPYDQTGSARRAFSTCLGPDCIDPLDEFLNYCLTIEQDGIHGLEDFITHMEKSDLQIKRESEDSEKESGNQVRIMTVHASKGLEAPIVFLPDTTALPNPSKTPRLLWMDKRETGTFPLWTDKTDNICALYKEARTKEKDREYAEYLRLLYVALTRARDHLYICGELKKDGFSKTNNQLTWYQLVKEAFPRLSGVEISGDRHIYELKSDITQKGIRKTDSIAAPLPAWLPLPPAKEKDIRHFVQPSLLGRTNDAALSPLQNSDGYRFERGILTHRLFQFLPQITPLHREKAATLFLKKSGSALPVSVRDEIAKEVLTVLNDPVFAPVFGPDSLAEVSVTGEIGEGRILSGQIDRLVVKKDRILIVDFKSNRPSPANESEIPQSYRDQLRAYKSAISKIYQNLPVECALLWTDKAILMPIKV
ncbi:MAG TPA: UvrD-helicase domain-containing protein, partial [Alphaproteobacteria bacterium]|nr:UvrD-helicase domain-containing protein [Alphaproteobacteria bacterium]